MSRSPLLGSVAYATETSFAEATDAWGTRMSVLGQVDLSGFTQEMVGSDRLTPYRNQVLPGVKSVKRGSFTTRHYLAGHGSTCAGAITLSDLETLLGIILGRGATDVAAASSSGGTTATAGGTVSSVNVSQVSGFQAGAIARAGVLGDARGNGQPFVVASHGTSIIVPTVNLPTALSAADVVYSPVCVNVPESPTANAIQSTRWLLQTGNQQVKARGVYPKGFTLTASNGQLPTFETQWGAAWFDLTNQTFPPAGTMQAHSPAPVAGGSFSLNTVGTATRQQYVIRDFTLSYSMQVVEQLGPGGVNAYQDVVNCVRVRDEITVDITLDADAAGTQTLADIWDSNAAVHMLYGFSAADSTAAGVYLPYCVPIGPRPTQMDMNGINSQRLRFSVGTGGTTTNERTLSAVRVFLG